MKMNSSYCYFPGNDKRKEFDFFSKKRLKFLHFSRKLFNIIDGVSTRHVRVLINER